MRNLFNSLKSKTIHLQIHFVPHRKHSFFPSDRSTGKCSVGKKINICFNTHMEHINTLCGQNVDILVLNLAVHTVTAKL